MKKTVRTGSAVLAALLLTTGLAGAQSTSNSELEELRDRIDALEAQQAEQEAAFEDARASLPEGFQLGGVESLGDPDGISGRNGLGRFSFGAGDATTVTIYGFVRAEAYYDLDFSSGDFTRIGRVGGSDFATDGDFETTVAISRFGIRSRSETDFGTIGTQLEFDLVGSGDEASRTAPTLRHANIRINDTWLIGQFWTNFMPIEHYPTTSDFNGPVGITFARLPQVRYTTELGDGLTFSASLEDGADSSQEFSAEPAATAALAYRTDDYSVRIAGLYSTF